MRLLRCVLLGIGLIYLGFAVPGAAAHRPDWGNEAGLTQIEDLSTSIAFYRELTTPGQVHVYRFQGQAGQHLHAGVSIPAIPGLEDYEVNLALLGPGLPEASHDSLPTEHPEGLGATVYPSVPGEDFFEPFTQTNYWGRQSIETDLPAGGEYFLLVWHPSGTPGKYVLDTGRTEAFLPGDLFRFPLWWVRVQLYFGHTTRLVGVAALLLAVIGAAIGVARRRQREAPRF